ncbi:MAG: type II toxin-antitoxin system RatA family toxin [Filomicrobium sp.]
MPKFSNRRKVDFTPSQMFDLVADVERYPEFVPMCETLTVRSRQEQVQGELLVATMGVGYKAIRESFTTQVKLMPEKQQIIVAYLDGPFRRLENRWRFLPAHAGQPGCVVDFYLDYEFRSRMLAVLMGAVFDKAFRKFSAAFEDRAKQVYGLARVPVGAVPTLG